MPGLMKLINTNKTHELLTGEIIQRQANSMYRVKIGNRTLTVQSLVPEDLPKHSHVIVAKTDMGFYIANKEQIKDRQKLEVIVDG